MKVELGEREEEVEALWAELVKAERKEEDVEMGGTS